MLIPELGYGGAEKSFISLSNVLRASNEVTIVVFQNNYREHYSSSFEVKPLSEVIALDDKVYAVGVFGRWYCRWKELNKLKLNHDVCISFLSGANLLNVLSSRRIPSIVSVRGSISLDYSIASFSLCFWKTILMPLTHMLAEHVVTSSTGLKEEICRSMLKVHRAKVSAIEGYVDSKSLVHDSDDFIEREVSSLGDSPLLILCGRLDKVKGFNHVIRVFVVAKEKVPDARLLVIGDGPELNSLTILCKQNNLSVANGLSELIASPNSDVVFLGYRMKPIRYFKLARALVLSSLNEGIPNVLIEGVASGVRCIASDCSPGIRLVLSNDPTKIIHASLPVEVEHGIIMPRIEEQSNEAVWVMSLISSLQAMPHKRLSREFREKSILKFDVRKSGKEWINLIRDLN